MIRNLHVHVEAATWPAGTSPPAGLKPGYTQFHIPSVLLLLGQLTTPPHRAGLTLGEYWAYVRYVNALTAGPDIELSKEYADLDSHQKTILSDDFGMGFTMSFVMDALGLKAPVDGRYFIKNLLGPTGAAYSGKGKRGPGKAPDFVAEDATGHWHIIECKGTQTGEGEHQNQMGKGITQKATLEFPPHVAGERLVAGMLIGTEGTGLKSTVTILDPDKRSRVKVTDGMLDQASDTAARGALAVALQLSGFPATASLVSAPDGTEPGEALRQADMDQGRTEAVERKRSASLQEIDAINERTDRGGFIGRKVEFELPGLRELSGGRLTKVEITNGISKELARDLGSPSKYEFGQSLKEQADINRDALSFQRSGSGNSAELRLGDAYLATLRLS